MSTQKQKTGGGDLAKAVSQGVLKTEHAAAFVAAPLAQIAALAPKIRLYDPPDLQKVARRKDLKKPEDRAAFAQQLAGAPEGTFAAALRDALGGARVPAPDHGAAPRTFAEAVAVSLRKSAADAADEFLPRFFAEADLATKKGAKLASDALRALARAAAEQKGFDRREPRWVRAAVDLEDHPLVGAAAKEAIAALDPAAVKAARAARGPAKPAAIEAEPAKRAPQAKVKAGEMLARYEGGDHDAVWKALRRLGAGVREGASAEEAAAVARRTMERFAGTLTEIVARLQKGGYALADAKGAVRRAAPDAPKKIAALEKRLGGPLPLSLRAFYEVLDGVDLREDEGEGSDASSPFEGFGHLDPLVIVPLATLAAEAKEAGAGGGAEVGVYLAPTTAHKYDPDDDVPDDRPLLAVLPDAGADARLRMQGARERHLVDYLRAAVKGGGFLGVVRDDAVLAKYAAPVQRVTKGLGSF
jgi:hypothetical protein